MLAAIQTAQARLDEFLKVSENRPVGAADFRLKVKFKEKGVNGQDEPSLRKCARQTLWKNPQLNSNYST
jgi:hypothetical protein